MTTSPRHTKLQFEGLSTDIKALIVERVVFPTDLQSLCRVNKQLHELAIKPLYRSVTFDLGLPNHNHILAFLHSSNKGLKYVRRLRLYLPRVRDRGQRQDHATFALRMLLEFLPEDILEEFRCDGSWDSWKSFPAENLLLLYKKQKRMKSLKIVHIDRPINPTLKKMLKGENNPFQHVRRLALHPESRDTLEHCAFYVRHLGHELEELAIRVKREDDRDISPPRQSIDPRDLQDSATRPGRLTRTLFGKMLKEGKDCQTFQNLTSLRLHRVSLRYCVDSWCKFVNFNQLSELRLYRCVGADALLFQLCKSAFLPKQLKALKTTHRDNEENETLVALDGFLCLVSGIQSLTIDFEGVKTLPAPAGIVRHSKTLKILSVHGSESVLTAHNIDTTYGEVTWNRDDFEKICKACSGLEQLSCAWPATNVLRNPSEEWKAFEGASGFLRGLVTLQISNWPTSPSHSKSGTSLLPRSVYEQLLQGLAQRAFDMTCEVSNLPDPFAMLGIGINLLHSSASSIATSSASNEDSDDSGSDNSLPRSPRKPFGLPARRLRLLAFGISDKIHAREESKQQIIFLRSTAQDARGKSKTHATPVTWSVRRFVEPRSDVLDIDLLRRETRPPCRDDRGPATWGVDDDDIILLPGPPPVPAGPMMMADFND